MPTTTASATEVSPAAAAPADDAAAAATATTVTAPTNSNGDSGGGGAEDAADADAINSAAKKPHSRETGNHHRRDHDNNNNNSETAAAIEDMYDLTKPIPKVDKPNKEAHEAELAELAAQIDALKAERAALQDKIDAAVQGGTGSSELSVLRSQMQALRLSKNKLIEEKKALRAGLDQAKAATDKLVKDKKDVKSNLKYGSLEEIEAEIKKLQTQQETTTMTLQQEKKLLKEMDALSASKKFVAVVQAKETAMEDVQLQRKSIMTLIADKDKEIDAASKELDAVARAAKEHSDRDTESRGAVQGLFAERDAVRARMVALAKQKDALRAAFRDQNNAWFQYQRALRAQKQAQYEQEKKRRDEEYAARKAELEAEEAKQIPYEEEQALCDFLAEYLERTYLGGGSKASGGDGDEKVAAVKDAPVAVTDDPFAGLTAVSKNPDEEVFFGKGKAKKKRVRAPKKDAASGGPFTLSVDSFEQFGLLQLSPPVSVDQVPASVAELRAKKEWYKEQPRGSVPTAAEIRKAAAAAKSRHANSAATSSATATTTEGKSSKAAATAGKKIFALSNEDFVPLGAAGSSSAAAVNSSWGQKSSATATAAAPESDAAVPPPDE